VLPYGVQLRLRRSLKSGRLKSGRLNRTVRR
jgi:hypothetical protein